MLLFLYIFGVDSISKYLLSMQTHLGSHRKGIWKIRKRLQQQQQQETATWIVKNKNKKLVRSWSVCSVEQPGAAEINLFKENCSRQRRQQQHQQADIYRRDNVAAALVPVCVRGATDANGGLVMRKAVMKPMGLILIARCTLAHTRAHTHKYYTKYLLKCKQSLVTSCCAALLWR